MELQVQNLKKKLKRYLDEQHAELFRKLYVCKNFIFSSRLEALDGEFLCETKNVKKFSCEKDHVSRI